MGTRVMFVIDAEHANRLFTLAYGFMLMLGIAGSAIAQDNVVPQTSAHQHLQHIHYTAID
jgi:hypothetical protein